MVRVVLAEPADADAANIIAELGSKVGATIAKRYNAHFDDVYRRLELFPEIGAPRTKLGINTRIVVVLPYVLV